MLSLALTSYEGSLCPGCGQPKDQAYNPDSNGWYEAREVVCNGCAAHAEHSGHDKKKPAAGAKVFIVDTRPKDVALQPWQPLAPTFSDG